MRAATRGVIDFHKARLLDVNWWRRLNFLLDEMAIGDNVQITDAAYRFKLALLSKSNLTEESFKKTVDESFKMFGEYQNLLRPWASDKVNAKTSGSEYRELYKKHCGDIDDPAYRAKLEAEAREMDAACSRQPYKNEEVLRMEVIQQRYEERAARKKERLARTRR